MSLIGRVPIVRHLIRLTVWLISKRQLVQIREFFLVRD